MLSFPFHCLCCRVSDSRPTIEDGLSINGGVGAIFVRTDSGRFEPEDLNIAHIS